eukprot:4154824-Pleurochrysis_carterae.AAC.1
MKKSKPLHTPGRKKRWCEARNIIGARDGLEDEGGPCARSIPRMGFEQGPGARSLRYRERMKKSKHLHTLGRKKRWCEARNIIRARDGLEDDGRPCARSI